MPHEASMGTRCQMGSTDLGPLVTQLPAAEKANLEALIQRQSALAVQFTGCTMRILPDCALAGSYVWQRTSPARDVVDIRSEADLFTRLPLGAVSLAGELERSGELSIETTVAGQYRLQGFTAAQVPQTPACLEATHIIGAMSVGAYSMRAADTIAGGTSVGYAGVAEMGGKTREGAKVLGSAGDAAACAQATPEAANGNCSSPIQVFLAPIPGRTEAAGPPGSIKVAFESSRPEERWDVYVDDEATCTTPCQHWVEPSRPIVLRSRLTESLDVKDLPSDQGPLQVTGHPTQRGKLATGITFTSLGGLAVLTGITLTAIGCASDNDGMCTAGLITLGAGLPVTAGSVLLIVDSMPRTEVHPIFDTRPQGFAFVPATYRATF